MTERAMKAFTVLSGLAISSAALAQGWVDFVDETSTRMPASLNNPATSTSDVEEKDYAWGDVDQDGDLDLVVVRKQPFTSVGKETNVLFMNEGTAEGHAINGIFADRTNQYATASDVPGDQGFLTPTNDRDVQLADINGDGWLDIVTAPTLTDNQAKHLSHPRIYVNLGEDGGVWQGFRYEDARIPQMHPNAGPRFCSVSVGDINNDGAPDLYFGDYDSGGSQISDYNNKLLINNGSGFFTDETNARLTSEMRTAAFGAASIIADVNNDGANDVIKQTSLNAPTHVAVTYNDLDNQGVFEAYDIVNSAAPYFVAEGDLNNDGRLDLVIVDDGTDTYLINQGNGGDGRANFTSLNFPSSSSSGFGGNAIIRDLNNDGFQDVIVTDVDVDIPGCSRLTAIYRNFGNLPNPTLQVQGQVIPNSMLTGVHDVAVMDINGDGWLDLVIGRCNETRIWMNEPPIGIGFTYPSGVPGFLTAGETTNFDVNIESIGSGNIDPSSAKFFYSVDGGAFQSVDMSAQGGDLYSVVIPAFDCPSSVEFYSEASNDEGVTATDPPNAPIDAFSALVAEGTEVTLQDEIEGDVSGWQISSQNLTNGEWEQAEPIGTISGGQLAAPNMDSTNGSENVMAFVTENGAPGGSAGAADLDGGPTFLVSPVIDLDGSDATISFDRWFFCDDEGNAAQQDFMQVQVSNNNGASWQGIQVLTTTGTGSAWETVSFVVSDYVTPSDQVRVRFVASDSPNNSVTEAGIDSFSVEEIVCGEDCPTDLDGDGFTAFGDLVQVLAAWGPCKSCDADFDMSGAVDFNDLVALLASFGECP